MRGWGKEILGVWVGLGKSEKKGQCVVTFVSFYFYSECLLVEL